MAPCLLGCNKLTVSPRPLNIPAGRALQEIRYTHRCSEDVDTALC